MSKLISIRLYNQVQDAVETMDLEFEDEEWARLECYYEYSGELCNTKFLLETGNSKLRIRGNKDGVTADATLPPADDVYVFLYKLRPLILESEYASYKRVQGILGRRIVSDIVRTFLKTKYQIYTGKRMQNIIKVELEHINVISEEILIDWLNSREYHRDPAIKRKIQQLEMSLTPDSFRFIMLTLLTEKARAIFALHILTEFILGKSKEEILDLRRV